ncbi:Chromosome partition protein Smc [Carpediemonas membranifera]|uniref:Chromosome partition protein Smc n=1 Tax=Carpediemonas membranifera TaxID=201153 RepID=A0A8J6E2W9_9EUKA|nr:Chromosome partition protein Smc [Carpediemonas membranifera]|eukprot:KAG9392407.1 Chromosome partition protein Smc [Carpediemonas membranifera]
MLPQGLSSEAEHELRTRLEQRIAEDRVIAQEMYYAKVKSLQEASEREIQSRERIINETARKRELRRLDELAQLQEEVEEQRTMKLRELDRQRTEAMDLMRQKVQKDANERARKTLEELERAKEGHRDKAGLGYSILGDLASLEVQDFKVMRPPRKHITEAKFDFEVKLPADMEAAMTAEAEAESEEEELGPVDRKDYNEMLGQKTELESKLTKVKEREAELQSEVKQTRLDIESQRTLLKDLKQHQKRLTEEGDERAARQLKLDTSRDELKRAMLEEDKKFKDRAREQKANQNELLKRTTSAKDTTEELKAKIEAEMEQVRAETKAEADQIKAAIREAKKVANEKRGQVRAMEARRKTRETDAAVVAALNAVLVEVERCVG